MKFFEAIILGIVQGATEFLPVSSSGHLIVIPKLLRISEGTWTFDSFLHLATGLAVLIYFWGEWKKMGLSFKTSLLIFNKSKKISDLTENKSSALFLYIMLASIPAGIVGFLFEKPIENTLRSPLVVVFTLIFFAILMLLVDKIKASNLKKEVTLWDSLVIGVSQVIALIPGTSRSGITIIAGLIQGLKREDAARFSFLLSTPIVLMAGVFGFVKALPYLNFSDIGNYVVGFVTAFFVGIFAIEFLIDYLKKETLKPFAYYRIALAIVVFVSLLV